VASYDYSADRPEQQSRILLESATATYGMVITVGRKGRQSGLHYFNARQRSAFFIKWNGEQAECAVANGRA